MATITFVRGDGIKFEVNNAEVSYRMEPISSAIRIPGLDNPLAYSLGGMMKTLDVSFKATIDNITITESSGSVKAINTIGDLFNSVAEFFGSGAIGQEYKIIVNDWQITGLGEYTENGVMKSVSITQKEGELYLSVRVSFYVGVVIF